LIKLCSHQENCRIQLLVIAN